MAKFGQKKWPRGQKIWPKVGNWTKKWLQNGYKFGQKWACGQKKWAIGHFLKNIWPRKWPKNGQKWAKNGSKWPKNGLFWAKIGVFETFFEKLAKNPLFSSISM